jgi:hypothetical protein
VLLGAVPAVVAAALLAQDAAAPVGAPAEELPAEVREVVALLALAPMIDRLRERPPAGEELQAQAIRSEIAVRVLEAALAADQVIARLAAEQADLGELHSWLEAREAAHTTRLNVAVGILSAGTAVGTGLTIFDRTARSGAIVGTVAGVLGAGASLLAARSPGPSRPPITVSSTMLAPFFGQPPSTSPPSYPPQIWSYLGTPAPGDVLARRERLLSAWRKLGRVPPAGTEAAREAIAQLVGAISPSEPVTSDGLADRLAMLRDVRAQVSSLKSALAATLTALRTDNRAPRGQLSVPPARPR